MVHKPWIDEVTFPCDKCAGTMRRVPEVIDCWFDSGCMPFAQLGYPHVAGSTEEFARAFPADFISEAIDQTRGWFYSLIAVSSLVFDDAKPPHPYKRCIVLGHVLDKVGKKESKSTGNYTSPDVILDAVRMEFASIGPDAPYAAGTKAPETGVAWIGREDLDGLDLSDNSKVVLYRIGDPDTRREVMLRVQKKLPRRVLRLADSDREALKLSFGPSDVMPVEVPGLPPDQRVMAEYEGMPAPGADAFRWFFLASGPPWNNTRHSLGNVRALQKEVPIKLRNVHSFFVTYANIDDFDPVKHKAHKRPAGERALLDRWVLSELEKTKRAVVSLMDDFRSYEATQAISSFVEGLSNWYVRRSRERFWAKGMEQDKLDAYWTLYQCLCDVSLTIAPFLPYAAEDMYQSLVVGQNDGDRPDSVHLESFPVADESLIDEPLSTDMREVRELVSLGLQVRASNKLKVRQPLRAADIVLSNHAREKSLAAYADIMKEELNVMGLAFLERADELVSYRVKPNFPALGKRLGPKMKGTQKALAGANPDELKRALDSDGVVHVDVEGDQVGLSNEELVITVEAKDGFAAASSPIGVVALETTLDEELIAEGLFREVLSKIQARRKELRLDFDARIRLHVGGSDHLVDICRQRADRLKSETLTVELALGGESAETAVASKVDGDELTLDVSIADPAESR